MKVAVCQFNPTVGALSQNAADIIRIYEQIARDNPEVELIVFPEMAITGYPIEDLALSAAFVFDVHKANTRVTHHVMDRADGPTLIVGSIMMAPESPQEGPIAQNVALIVEPQGYVQTVVKHEMANYGVFDEKRTFQPGDVSSRMWNPYSNVAQIKGKMVGVLICEDGWHERVPTSIPGIVEFNVWINASPFEIGKRFVRRDIAYQHFAEKKKPVIYANMCGAQDELVFDGGSFMMLSTATQSSYQDAPDFQPNSIVIFDTDIDVPDSHPNHNGSQAIYQALVCGLRDYMMKNGFRDVVLGMSGGVDSALVAAIACDAVGPDRVSLIGLPSVLSSEGSIIDASKAASQLGAKFTIMGIGEVVDAVHATYRQERFLDDPEPHLLTGLAAENLQARVRGLLLMAESNQNGQLLVTTGNKSETSTGFSTIYGDMAGGFNPLKDCYKTTVWDLCAWRNTMTGDQIDALGFFGSPGEMIPRAIIEKPPSAELSEGQRDDQSLPAYEILDSILKKMTELRMSNAHIIEAGHDPHIVERVRYLVDRAEYKRRQAAPGTKITSQLHGRDRRIPITNHWHG